MSTVASLCGFVTLHNEQPGRGTQQFLAFFILLLFSKTGNYSYFWDYAGGAMTDWGVHLIDPVHQCFDEVMPTSITAMGSKLYVDDNCETPDTMMATFHYPKFLLTYESRTANPMPMFGHGAPARLAAT